MYSVVAEGLGVRNRSRIRRVGPSSIFKIASSGAIWERVEHRPVAPVTTSLQGERAVSLPVGHGTLEGLHLDILAKVVGHPHLRAVATRILCPAGGINPNANMPTRSSATAIAEQHARIDHIRRAQVEIGKEIVAIAMV